MNFVGQSDSETLKELGRRLKRARLNINMSQEQLARQSGLSRKTITNVESGIGGSLHTLIAILRGLGLLAELNAFIPQPGISPVQLAKLQGKQRKRASQKRSKTTKNTDDWKWDQ
jgi:putative transcriptional regulator